MDILGLRHRPSGVNTRFDAEEMPFADYVLQTRAMLDAFHAGKNEQEIIVEGNAPFELLPTGNFEKGRKKPFKRGVLLTHGLLDSPYHMQHLAAFFQRNGFRVMAVLLPGHGTRPGDLLEMRWEEWAKTVAYGADRMAEEVDELYLAGFSAGAALSVLHARHDRRVRGLFLFSPALKIDPLARWANLHKLYSWLLPKGAWVSCMQDRDLYKYESFCKNAAAQMYALTLALPKREVDIPVFAVASADDATVNSGAAWRYMQSSQHACSKLVWYATEKVDQPNVEWINSALPEKHILSSAHTAIVMPPQDTHYGEKGDYINCLHYYEGDKKRYTACCAQAQEVSQGEILEQNLKKGLLRRLMYNPHYAEMESSMQKFIENLP